VEPLVPGLIPVSMKVCFAAWDGLVLSYMWRNWSFNAKSWAFLLGGCAF